MYAPEPSDKEATTGPRPRSASLWNWTFVQPTISPCNRQKWNRADRHLLLLHICGTEDFVEVRVYVQGLLHAALDDI